MEIRLDIHNVMLAHATYPRGHCRHSFPPLPPPISGLLAAAVSTVHPWRIMFSVGVTALLCRGLLGVSPFDLFARRVLGIRGNKLGYRRRLPVEDLVS